LLKKPPHLTVGLPEEERPTLYGLLKKSYSAASDYYLIPAKAGIHSKAE